MYFEQTCVVYLIERPSVGRGLRLEDIYLEPRRCILRKLVFLLNCEAFGGSRAKTRRCISRHEIFLSKLVMFT